MPEILQQETSGNAELIGGLHIEINQIMSSGVDVWLSHRKRTGPVILVAMFPAIRFHQLLILYVNEGVIQGGAREIREAFFDQGIEWVEIPLLPISDILAALDLPS